jgi:hypothetical protein
MSDCSMLNKLTNLPSLNVLRRPRRWSRTLGFPAVVQLYFEKVLFAVSDSMTPGTHVRIEACQYRRWQHQTVCKLGGDAPAQLRPARVDSFWPTIEMAPQPLPTATPARGGSSLATFCSIVDSSSRRPSTPDNFYGSNAGATFWLARISISSGLKTRASPRIATFFRRLKWKMRLTSFVISRAPHRAVSGGGGSGEAPLSTPVAEDLEWGPTPSSIPKLNHPTQK